MAKSSASSALKSVPSHAERLRQSLSDTPSTTQAPTPWALETMEIAIKAINDHGDNVRRAMDPVELAQLQASLAQYGLLEPVIVQPLSKKRAGFRYQLVAGFRRVAAAKALGWDAIPARVLQRELDTRERVAIQLTENLQRESMRVRDIVQSVQGLKAEDMSVATIAETLGLGASTVRLYGQLGDLLAAYPKLWQYFDRGLITIEQFRVASRLLTRIRERAGSKITDPAELELIRAEAEQLFVEFLERLAKTQPLTIKRVGQEVSRWLATIGIVEPESAPSKAGGTPLVKPLFASLDRLDLTALAAPELEAFITLSEAKLDAAKAQLEALARQR